MKEVVTNKTVNIEEHKFVSDDGKEFDTYNDCRNYEANKHHESVLKEFERISEPLNLPLLKWANDECEFYIVNLNNKDDYYRLYDYKQVVDCLGGDLEVSKEYPCEVVCFEGCDYFTTTKYTKAEIIETLEKCLLHLKQI